MQVLATHFPPPPRHEQVRVAASAAQARMLLVRHGCTSAVLWMRRAREAKRNVLSVSSTYDEPGETVEIMTARAEPPRHGCSSRVSFESRSDRGGHTSDGKDSR